MMKGYVENVGMAPAYILKGVVGKGERISFDVLLKRFGSEAGTKDVKSFASWLSRNKFSNASRWRVVVEDVDPKPKKKVSKESPIKVVEEIVEVDDEKTEEVEEIKFKPKKEVEKNELVSKVTATNNEIITHSVSGVTKKLTVDDIVNMKVSRLKDLERVRDEKLLREALRKAETMNKKATLCNKLRDRLLAFDMR